MRNCACTLVALYMCFTSMYEQACTRCSSMSGRLCAGKHTHRWFAALEIWMAFEFEQAMGTAMAMGDSLHTSKRNLLSAWFTCHMHASRQCRWGISGLLPHYSVQYWHHWIAKIEIFATCPCLHGLMHLNLLTQPLQVACLHHVNFTWTWHHSKPGSKQLPGLLPTQLRCNSFQVRYFRDSIALFCAILAPLDS